MNNNITNNKGRGNSNPNLQHYANKAHSNNENIYNKGRSIKNNVTLRRWFVAALAAAALSEAMYSYGYNRGADKEVPPSLKERIIMSDIGDTDIISSITVNLDGKYSLPGQASNPQLIKFLTENSFPELDNYLKSGKRDELKILKNEKMKQKLAFYNFYLLKAAIADAIRVDDYKKIHIEYEAKKNNVGEKVGNHIMIYVDKENPVIDAIEATPDSYGDIQIKSNYKDVLPNYNEILSMINSVDDAEKGNKLNLKNLLKQYKQLSGFLENYKLAVAQIHEGGPRGLFAEEKDDNRLFYKLGDDFSKVAEEYDYLNQAYQR